MSARAHTLLSALVQVAKATTDLIGHLLPTVKKLNKLSTVETSGVCGWTAGFAVAIVLSQITTLHVLPTSLALSMFGLAAGTLAGKILMQVSEAKEKRDAKKMLRVADVKAQGWEDISRLEAMQERILLKLEKVNRTTQPEVYDLLLKEMQAISAALSPRPSFSYLPSPAGPPQQASVDGWSVQTKLTSIAGD